MMGFKSFKVTLLFVLVYSFFGVKGQTTLTLQPDPLSGKDAFVDSRRSTDNFGTTPDHFATAWTNGGVFVAGRSLLDFDLSSIPTNSIITSAQLYLYGYNSVSNVGHSTRSGSNDAVLQRIIQTWHEDSVNWNNQPNTTQLNEVMLLATTSINENKIADVTNMVQNMVDSASTSFGFLLKLNTEINYRSMLFASSDNQDSTIRPKLVITYTNGVTGINELNTHRPSIDIYPNPTLNEKVTLDLKELIGNKDVAIFDIKGRLVYSERSISSKLTLDLGNFSKGIFLVKVIDENNTLATRKLIKR